MPEIDRRDFLKLVGAGAGAAAASGCSDPVEKLIPYVVQPEEITPGLPVIYASTCQECPAACGLHVRTREGRPIKLEGNPDHPINRGALCPRGQAGIQRTYSPDRFHGPLRREAGGGLVPIPWEAAARLVAERVAAAPGGTRVLGGATGPTLSGLLDQWVAAVGAGPRVVYEPFAPEALREAARVVFGTPALPVFDLSGADFVVDFGSDFSEGWLSPVEHARQLAEARDPLAHPGGGARFVYVGPRLSQTAGSADEWIPALPGSEGLLALALANVAVEKRGDGGASDLLKGVLAKFGPAEVAGRVGVPERTIRGLGEALAASQRPVALPPGVALSGSRAVSVAAAVLILNAALGAVGSAVRFLEGGAGGDRGGSYRAAARLVEEMQRGGVAVLLVHGANPAYSLPPGLSFAEAAGKVELLVSFASSPDETSALADLILPDHTPLESWGDAEPRPGVRSLVQPTIRPLYDTQALGDTLLQIGRAMGESAAAKLPAGSFRGVLEAAWSGGDWRAALARGGVFAGAPVASAALSPELAKLDFAPAPLDGDGEFALLAHPSPLLSDGRGANLSWLQETPDPVTGISWQSWAELSSKTASSLGVTAGDTIELHTASGRVELPAYPRGGIRDDVIAVAVGQGHTVGSFASRAGAPRGVNVISLLPPASDESGGRAWLATRVEARKTGRFERLALSQGSDNQRGRGIGQSVALAALAPGGGDPAHGGEAHGAAHPEVGPAARDQAAFEAAHSPYDWGMTIDLDRCTGCAACVVACSIENNVPTVGEDGSIRRRQMTWIRINRFIGDGEPELVGGRPPRQGLEELGKVDVRPVPMLCQQCDRAPCEPVCPVLATYHSPQGLNAMIYNRCIGTRYCSNNCPYKVRRFNYFDYSIERWPDPMPLGLNPDVTVRGQGVMEKCTFCVQRILAAEQPAKDAGRLVADGEVVPACAQTCPTRAITFGNTKDAASRVVRSAEANAARGYTVFPALNTKPAITYLARVRRAGAEDRG